jgi:uncharacterized protein (DUF2062 family)
LSSGFFRQRLRAFYRALFPEGQSAVLVAISVFVGVFIAVLPTIGVALPLTVLVTTLCRLPKGPGLVASFVATPPTLFLFFYPLGYFLGRTLTAPPAIDLELLSELQQLSLYTIREVVGRLWQDARPHLLAFMFGILIVSLITAAIIAAASYWIIARRAAISPR